MICDGKETLKTLQMASTTTSESALHMFTLEKSDTCFVFQAQYGNVHDYLYVRFTSLIRGILHTDISSIKTVNDDCIVRHRCG